MNKKQIVGLAAFIGLCPLAAAQSSVTADWPAQETTVATKSTSMAGMTTMLSATAQSDAPASSSFMDKLYFTTDVGLNWVPDIGVKDLNFALGGANIVQITNNELSMDLGVRWDIGIGYEFTDNFRVQLETGILHNNLDNWSGTVVDTIGLFSGIPGATANFDESDSSGHLRQIPIMVSGIYEFDMGDGDRTDKGAGASWRFKPYIGGGIGAVHIDSDMEIDRTLDLGHSGNDWVFGYQAMAGIEYEITDNWFVSISYRFLGLTEGNLGPLELNGVPINQFTLDLDEINVKSEAVYNHSLQFGLRIEF